MKKKNRTGFETGIVALYENIKHFCVIKKKTYLFKHMNEKKWQIEKFLKSNKTIDLLNLDLL